MESKIETIMKAKPSLYDYYLTMDRDEAEARVALLLKEAKEVLKGIQRDYWGSERGSQEELELFERSNPLEEYLLEFQVKRLIQFILEENIKYNKTLCGFIIRNNNSLRRVKTLDYDNIYARLMELALSISGTHLNQLCDNLNDVTPYAYMKEGLLAISFTTAQGKIISDLEDLRKWMGI